MSTRLYRQHDGSPLRFNSDVILQVKTWADYVHHAKYVLEDNNEPHGLRGGERRASPKPTVTMQIIAPHFNF